MATIKAGAYKFNDRLTTNYSIDIDFDLNYTTDVFYYGMNLTVQCDRVRFNGGDLYYSAVSTSPFVPADYPFLAWVYGHSSGWQTVDWGETVRVINILEDQEVPDWFIENLNTQTVIAGRWEIGETAGPLYANTLSEKYDNYYYGYELISEVNFTTSTEDENSNWVGFKVGLTGDGKSEISYANSSGSWINAYNEVNGWLDDSYREINFDIIEQTVFSDLVNWLNTYATALESEDSAYVIKKSTLKMIANSIRMKTGKTSPLNPLDMAAEILTISGGDLYLGEVEVE